ncbi:NADP-dependent oxidoreductase [Promicromonospora thailandica]|uniref:NADPH:quinone reductase n=1 Tax=Promicromonospora thailandica TaxID=765201 RepID=A0A9X2JXL6_9MICO|nr:NADP-dependent oxidoreductase [Promicromonospora thailandica]MCP2267391.1 NADPH:quinone reductase [Promicromonospora thailandica]BFF19589.1 NADP-dependent oxidoreductase [Promicromonospora thailandica]
MRAYRLTSYEPDGFALTDVPEPATGPGQVKVRVEQIGVNPLEWKIRKGYVPQMVTLPLVLGTDVAGTVVETGPGVDDLTVGDRVAGFVDSGAYAALAVTRRERVTRVPDGLDLVSAAALVTAAETARRAIDLLDLAPGSTVVVNGAAGSVGSAAVQLLAAAGHHVVGTASAANHDVVRSWGATPVTYGETMVEELRAAAPGGVDAAVDTAGRDFVARVADLVPARRVVTITDFAAAQAGAIVTAGDPARLTAEAIGPVLALAAQGSFAVRIDSVHPFEDVDRALARSEQGHPAGKVVLSRPTA